MKSTILRFVHPSPRHELLGHGGRELAMADFILPIETLLGVVGDAGDATMIREAFGQVNLAMDAQVMLTAALAAVMITIMMTMVLRMRIIMMMMMIRTIVASPASPSMPRSITRLTCPEASEQVNHCQVDLPGRLVNPPVGHDHTGAARLRIPSISKQR